ncbi:MAG: fumarate reductase subunit C [Sutterella sp.]|nr:fumarate reductase subunit C [Sutterella sp.]
MSTPDSVKYANTPSANENVWGAGLKDAKRQSPKTAYLDVAQSVTGLILGLFLFCHMAFTSSVQFGKDVFANLILTSGGAFFDGHEHAWMHVLFVGFITLTVAIHAFCALRRFPTSYHQFRDIKAHWKLLRHEDTTLWVIQIVTGALLFLFVFTHLMPMLFNPHGFDPNLIGVHTFHMGMLYTFIFLVITELHGMIGLYRLLVKWEIFNKNAETNLIDQRERVGDRAGARKTMLIVALVMIVLGTLTAYKNYSIGQEQVNAQQESARYQLPDDKNWYKN